jgi:ribosome recycling factor
VFHTYSLIQKSQLPLKIILKHAFIRLKLPALTIRSAKNPFINLFRNNPYAK